LQELSEELMAKNELIEEANQLLTEFEDQKHELKAKFKYLVAQVQDLSCSTYKSTDQIDIDYCFEVLEQ